MEQEISTETTPAQVTTEVSAPAPQSTPTEAAAPTGAPAAEPENWEYTGDRKAVPAAFEKYVKGLDRYVSKKDQAAADTRKKAEEYDHFVGSDAYKSYQQFIANQPRATGPAAPSQPALTDEEAAAISVGDTNMLAKVIQREVQRNIDANVGPKEAALKKDFESLAMKQKQIENAEMIQSFAEVHTDFWDLYDAGFEDYIVTSIRSGRSLEEVYKGAKEIESKTAARLETNRKADAEKKKNGTVVGKSIPGTPDVVLANDEAHAKRLAIELTLKGDKRHVRIKPKK